MATLHQGMGRHPNGERPPGGSPSGRESRRFARYQRAKIHQEIQAERRAALRHWHVDDTEPLPFGALGRPQFETFDDPVGLELPLAPESLDEVLIQEIEDQMVRIWRNNALTFAFVAIAVIAVRVAGDRFDVDWFAPWFLDLAIIVCTLIACTSAFTAYFVRSVSDQVQKRHHIERARMRAITARRTKQSEQSEHQP
ncbi:MAG: hypothetical protein AAF531_12580 [Actinomycetota bacterium]